MMDDFIPPDVERMPIERMWCLAKQQFAACTDVRVGKIESGFNWFGLASPAQQFLVVGNHISLTVQYDAKHAAFSLVRPKHWNEDRYRWQQVAVPKRMTEEQLVEVIGRFHKMAQNRGAEVA